MFALQEGMVERESRGPTVVNVWQVNTSSKMQITFPDAASSEPISIPGVPGVEDPILVEWVAPEIGREGALMEKLPMHDGTLISATIVEAGNPSVIVRARDFLGCGADVVGSGTVSWSDVDTVRAAAAEKIGCMLTSGIRLVLVDEPREYTSTSGTLVSASDYDLRAWITADGNRVHHAFTGTGSINVACAALVPGTIPNETMKVGCGAQDQVRIAHPSGVMNVFGASRTSRGGWTAVSAGFYRTARVLMKGEVAV